jgi:IS605 OrfB family transposase
VSGRAIRAEHHLHHADAKARNRAAARRAPKPGQRGSRRWRQHRRRQRRVEARHRRRVAQAQHEAAATVIDWAVQQRVGTLAVGDPRGVLHLAAGRRHNRRVRDWRVGHLISVLRDKAEQAGITVTLVDERGSSSTCPKCYKRVPKPSGRVFTCPHCPFRGHRDLVAGFTSPPVLAAGSRQSLSRLTSRTVGPEHTFPVCPRPGVTRAAALITAAPAGPLAGTSPPRPSRAGSRSPHREDPVSTRRTYGDVH